MSSKPKSRTYIVLHLGGFKEPVALGRYRVGARSPKEAESILRNHLSVHKVSCYYHVPDTYTPYGTVVKES